MSKRKKDSDTVSRQKYNRHRLLAFTRMIKYGIDSFLRNSWLSIAATAVMTITLLIVFVSVATQNVLNDTLADLQKKVDMSIYLVTDTPDNVGSQLVVDVKKLPSVSSASYISSAEAREQIAQDNKDDEQMIEAIKEADNKLPGTLRVVLININETNELETFVANNELVKQYKDPDHKESFAGERRQTINNIGSAINFAQQIGIVAGAVFIVISALIIFNTIRMAIFNRREEIQMMKLIGADHSFIRGPFLIEAMIYGVIAAVIATVLGTIGLDKISVVLDSYQITVQPTINFITNYSAFVLGGMIVMGAFVGVVSSMLATYRYLKL